MPEIGECYSIAKTLNKPAQLKKIDKIKVSSRYKTHIAKGKIPVSRLSGSIVEKIEAYGKSILFYCIKDSKKYIMVSQLGMSGSWFINDSFKERGHFHLKILLNNSLWLKYSDPRMFGKVWIFSGDTFDDIKAYIIKQKKWGIDPIQSSIDQIYSKLLELQSSKKKIKEKLLEQNLIFGIGNYLASEVLFDCKINPLRSCDSLSTTDFQRLSYSIKKWVILAEKSGGFSFAGGYILPDGSLGDLKSKIKVYGKEGKTCTKCKEDVINKVFISGRSTFFCPSCQK